MSDVRKIPITYEFYDQHNGQIHLKTEVHILNAGGYIDSIGDITVDVNDLQEMVNNFNDNARGIDIAIDAGHDSNGPAYAWIKRLYIVDTNQLWGTVEWNEIGKEAVGDKRFRYMSAEFQFSYTNNETGVDYGATLFGAALTNRPFVKSLTPLIFGETNMPLPQNQDVAKLMSEMETMKSQMTDTTKKLTEYESKSKESDDKIKKLSEDLESQIRKNIELVDKNKSIEKKKEFDEKLSGGLVCEAQREAFMKDDMASFVANMQKPNLTPHSTNFTDDGKEKVGDVQDEVIELAKAKVKDDSKLTLSEAIVHVLKEKPALARKYNEIFN